MQAVNFNNETLTIQDANSEIQQKIRQYFNSYGLTKEGHYGSVGPDLGRDEHFAMWVDGQVDGIEVNITYCDFKTKKQVQRDILALDDRIERVNLWRSLSEKEWEAGIDRLMMEPMYVMVDGQLMRTTIYEWVGFSTRNIDFTKKCHGRMA